MSRTSKAAAVVASLGLVVTGGLWAAPLQGPSAGPTPSEAPEGIDQGLWELLPETDRAAILGAPYPALAPATSAEPAPAAARTPHVAPVGIDQGLWELLPDEDRRAILGEPYPTLYAEGARSPVAEVERTLAPPPGHEEFACLPVEPTPRAC